MSSSGANKTGNGGDAELQVDGPQPTSGRVTDIVVRHGPADQLNELFRKADTEARRRGVELTFAPVCELAEVQARNSDTWRPLLPIFCSKLGGFDQMNGFAFLGRDAKGDVVATQAARLYVLDTTSLYDEFTSFRAFYADPAASRLPNEDIEVTAQSMKSIVGRICYSGATWLRPDYRGKWMTGIMPRISRAYAYTRWKTDVTCTIMHENIVRGGTSGRAGYTHVEFAVLLKNFAIGSHRMAFMHMSREEMFTDMRGYLLRGDTQID